MYAHTDTHVLSEGLVAERLEAKLRQQQDQARPPPDCARARGTSGRLVVLYNLFVPGIWFLNSVPRPCARKGPWRDCHSL